MSPQDTPVQKGETTAKCQRCGAVADRLHRHAGLQVCETCYVDTWRPHHRKPHWCYLRSIKGEYLRPTESE